MNGQKGVLRMMKEQGSSSSFGLYRQLIRTELKVITALVLVTSIHTAELRGQLLMVIQPRPGISTEVLDARLTQPDSQLGLSLSLTLVCFETYLGTWVIGQNTAALWLWSFCVALAFSMSVNRDRQESKKWLSQEQFLLRWHSANRKLTVNVRDKL